MTALLELKNVACRYDGGTKNVLNGVGITFESGKLYAIMGRPGSGKTTLLSLLAGRGGYGGEVRCNGQDLRAVDRDRYRAKSIGAVLQGDMLLPNATAVENVLLSMNISEVEVRDKRARAHALLQQAGIDRVAAERKAVKLSEAERRRVSLARALSHDPNIILADEPTAGLDAGAEADLIEMLEALAHGEKKCVIVTTQSKRMAAVADEIWALSDGNLLLIRCAEDEWE